MSDDTRVAELEHLLNRAEAIADKRGDMLRYIAYTAAGDAAADPQVAVERLKANFERSEQALTVARTELAQGKAKWAHTAERIVESYARLTEKLFDQRLYDISDGTAPKTQDGGR
jgi:hypothetical protein